MTRTAARSSRSARGLAASLTAAAVLLGGPSAWAAGASAPSATAGSESALQIQAQELAGQIQADGRNLDRLAESLDSAQLRSQQLGTQLRDLKAAMVRTDTRTNATRNALKQQALLAYLAGGAPIISNVPNAPGADPSITISYAEIVTRGEQRAVSAYRSAQAEQSRLSTQLTGDQQQAAQTIAVLRADGAAAAQAESARQDALAQVKGQLATLVAQVEAAQQKAEQAAIQANLTRETNIPAPSATPTAAPASSPRVTPGRTGPTRTTSPPTRSTNAPPPTTSTPTTIAPPPPPAGNAPARGSATAVHYAYAQLGKPYQWAGAGPSSFDCSGLTMMAWAAAGVSLPHLAQAQYDMTRPVPLADVQPGDLIFFGTPNDVYHVGISIGGGQMIDAPETGQNVSISSIYWSNLLGAGRIQD